MEQTADSTQSQYSYNAQRDDDAELDQNNEQDPQFIGTDTYQEQPDQPITQTDPIEIAKVEEPDDQELNDNPYIMSRSIPVGPYSFVDFRQPYEQKSPPPKYFSDELLLTPLPTKKDEILRGLEEQKHGGLVCTDQEAMDRQRGVLMNVVKQLTVNLFKGLTITHISLPIKIFEPRSSIQRIVDMWSFGPKFLRQAADTTDHLERFRQVIAFAMSGLYICSSQYKPFNPILGETLQGEFNDGTQIYCEHTSHHPPITNFHMQPQDKSFNFYGYYEFTANMGANSLKSGLRGPNNIVFADGQHIRFRTPDFLLGGTVMGDRTIEAAGNVFFEDLTNNYKAVVILSTYKKSGFFKKSESGKRDQFTGIIYHCKPIEDPVKSAKKLYSKHAIEISDLNKIKDMVKPIGDINGSFLYNMTICGKKYWDIDTDVPERFKPVLRYVAPSDWRYREDLIWLKYNYMKIAAQWKVRMEEQQRHDRRLRQKQKDKK